MNAAIVYLNLLVALVSAAFGIVAIYRPRVVNPEASGGADEKFFVFMYAARTIPFGLVAGILPLLFGGWAVAAALFAAALIQLADVAIALSRRIAGMAIGAGVATLVHIACGFVVL